MSSKIICGTIFIIFADSRFEDKCSSQCMDGPVARVCAAEVPLPYAKHLEDAALPSVEGIVAAARQALGVGHG